MRHFRLPCLRGLLFLSAIYLGDFALASQTAPAVSPASFRPRVTRDLTYYGLWTAAGDFNGDGRVDVSVGSNGGSQFTTFYTQADGTLPLAGIVTIMPGATRLRAADFNADKCSDLLLISGNGMEVRYGQTNNTFSAPVTIGSTGYHNWGRTAIADLNRDGRFDAIVTDATSTTNAGGFLSSYRTAAGGFSAPSWQGTRSSSAGVTVADLNRDGYPDVVVGDLSTGIRVAYGSAAGTFTVKAFAIGSSDRAYDLTAGDFNRDGIPDVAFPAWSHNAVGVMLTQANGDLGAPTFYTATSTPDSIATGDFNRDGRLDLVASGEWGSGIAVLLGNGSGTFGSPLLLNGSANGTSTVSVADFDGNGYDDIAYAGASGQKLDIFYNGTVPEPNSLALLGLTAVAFLRRPRK